MYLLWDLLATESSFPVGHANPARSYRRGPTRSHVASFGGSSCGGA